METSSQLLVKMKSASGVAITPRSYLKLTDKIALEPLDINTEAPLDSHKSFFNAVDFPVDWFTTAASRTIQGWDEAHEFYSSQKNKGICYVEPDINHEIYDQLKDSEWTADEYIDAWQPLPDDKNEFAWYLDSSRTQLRDALAEVSPDDLSKIRIAHLDTGYDKYHHSKPSNTNAYLQRNFIQGEDLYSAIDQYSEGILKQPGHGTGTLAILAGGHVSHKTSKFNGVMGAAPYAEIIPIRIGKSVVHFKSSSFAKAVQYAINTECDVISMSMGGVASKLWAERVNQAYEAGIVVVTAAGNNFSGLPIRELVYPARFERVIAACGITYGNKPYFKHFNDPKIMQGCWGPADLMEYALSAYTPNVPWAEFGKSASFRRSGGGTSSATPQIAGSAALLLAKLHDHDFPEMWQRAETVRQLLFATAQLKGNDRIKVGKGVIQARQALDILNDGINIPLVKAPEARVNTGWLGLIFGSRFPQFNSDQQEMLEVELMQLSFKHKEIIESINRTTQQMEEKNQLYHNLNVLQPSVNEIREIIKGSKRTSEFLKNAII